MGKPGLNANLGIHSGTTSNQSSHTVNRSTLARAMNGQSAGFVGDPIRCGRKNKNNMSANTIQQKSESFRRTCTML
jgi:hypothetical protein